MDSNILGIIEEEEPLVSIIIPAYNAEKYISVALDSAISQTWKNIEIIVINDGSKDKTYSIVNTYLQKNVRKIIYYEQENKGAAIARNIGISLSKGQYIQFLDADDFIPSDKVEKQINVLRLNYNCIIGCKWVRFLGTIDNVLGKVGPDSSISLDLDPTDWLLQFHTMLLHAWLIPRDLIEKSGGWNGNLSFNDDGEFISRVIKNSRRVLFSENTIVYYRTENANSLSNININYAKKIKSYTLSLFSYIEVLISLENSIRVRRKAAESLARLYFEHYPFSLFIRPSILKRVHELGGSEFKYSGNTPTEKRFIKIFGWRITLLLKNILSKIRQYS